MANHFSALKRMRQSRKRAEANKARRTRLRHELRELRRAILAGDSQRAQTLLGPAVSVIDKSLKKGIIKERTAGRFKSRLMARLAALKKSAAAA